MQEKVNQPGLQKRCIEKTLQSFPGKPTESQGNDVNQEYYWSSKRVPQKAIKN